MICRSWWRRLPTHLTGDSVTHERALKTREPSYMPRPVRLFFIPEARGPLSAAWHVVVSEPSQAGSRVQSRGARGSVGALLSREVGSKAAWHVAASEPSRAGRQGPKPWDTWQRRSPLKQGGGVRSYRACGSTSCSLSWTWSLYAVVSGLQGIDKAIKTRAK
jgi:hypothetical protein